MAQTTIAINAQRVAMGSARQVGPHRVGRTQRRRTEERVRPVTKTANVKKSGVGHSRDFGNGVNLGMSVGSVGSTRLEVASSSVLAAFASLAMAR